MSLLSNIESLSERVVYQEGKLIPLRSGYESLQKELG